MQKVARYMCKKENDGVFLKRQLSYDKCEVADQIQYKSALSPI